MKCMLGVQSVGVQPYGDKRTTDEWTTAELQKLKLNFPMLASRKLDGIRCLVIKGVPYSRDMKLIPNLHIREFFEHANFSKAEIFDGELIAVDQEGNALPFNETASAIMKREGTPLFCYNIFELDSPASMKPLTSIERYTRLIDFYGWFTKSVRLVEQLEVNSIEEILTLEKRFLGEGYEGLMLKGSKTLYKHGRSTLREQALLKVTRCAYAEATIEEVLPLMHNMNEAVTSGAGKTKRSSKKENLIATQILGAIRVSTKEWGEFNIGSFANWSRLEKVAFWQDREKLVGKKLIFKYKPYGSKDKPRHPIGCILLSSEEERNIKC